MSDACTGIFRGRSSYFGALSVRMEWEIAYIRSQKVLASEGRWRQDGRADERSLRWTQPQMNTACDAQGVRWTQPTRDRAGRVRANGGETHDRRNY
jgi:hypothetical protein